MKLERERITTFAQKNHKKVYFKYNQRFFFGVIIKNIFLTTIYVLKRELLT